MKVTRFLWQCRVSADLSSVPLCERLRSQRWHRKPHILFARSPRPSNQSRPQPVEMEGPFIFRLAPSRWHLVLLSKIKNRAFCSLNPLHCLLGQMDNIIQIVVRESSATTGDAEPLPEDIVLSSQSWPTYTSASLYTLPNLLLNWELAQKEL